MSLTTAQKRVLHHCPGCGHLLDSHDGVGCAPCADNGERCDMADHPPIDTTYAAVECLLLAHAAAPTAELERLREVERERDEFFARLTNREREWAERQAETAALGDTGICRNCVQPITYAVVSEPRHLDRTGWSDGARRDALVCFQAVHYRHVPIVGRERALWDEATKRAQAAPAGRVG